MVYLAVAPLVRTTGINWQSLGAILAALVAAVGLIIAIQERRNRAITTQITESVNHLAQVLEAKLETKETVAGLSVRVARMEGQMIRSGHSSGSPGAPTLEG